MLTNVVTDSRTSLTTPFYFYLLHSLCLPPSLFGFIVINTFIIKLTFVKKKKYAHLQPDCSRSTCRRGPFFLCFSSYFFYFFFLLFVSVFWVREHSRCLSLCRKKILEFSSVRYHLTKFYNFHFFQQNEEESESRF